MSNIKFLKGAARDPRTMLAGILEEADQFEDVIVMVRRKDDQGDTWCTTKNPAFLSVSALVLQQLALDAVKGRIVDE